MQFLLPCGGVCQLGREVTGGVRTYKSFENHWATVTINSRMINARREKNDKWSLNRNMSAVQLVNHQACYTRIVPKQHIYQGRES